MKMISAMLEGRGESAKRAVHDQLAEKLGPDVLRQRIEELGFTLSTIEIVEKSRGANKIAELQEKIDDKLLPFRSFLFGKKLDAAVSDADILAASLQTLDDNTLQNIQGLMLEECFDLFNVAMQLSAVQDEYALKSLEPTEDGFENSDTQKFVDAWEYLCGGNPRIRYVEVLWNGSIQILPFAMPSIEPVAIGGWLYKTIYCPI